MRSLEGQTALVTGGGAGLGRAIALALSARGVRIMVTGRDEKALGETVGEIAHGGGKARHAAGEIGDEAHVRAAVDRAIDVFGGLDIVIHAEATGVECTFKEAAAKVRAPGRLLVTVVGVESAEPAGLAGLSGVVREHAKMLGGRGLTCNAIVLDGARTDDAVDDAAADVAELVVFLCGRAADGITGQGISIRAREA